VTALARQLRARIDAVDPEIQTGTPNTLEALVDARLIGPRFNYVLVGLLATLSLVLAAAGVYAVLAYLVAQRRREIAIRLALGETRAAVVGRMLREGAGMASVGIAIGTAGAFALSRFLESMLHGVSARDASTYAGTVGAMLIVAIVASLTPALRASRVDPASILKDS
jgi:ABC-type antimicrobial peptide transport system permease subunit